jgi:phytoene desaturase
MHALANALYEIAKKNGVKFHFNAALDGLDIKENKVEKLKINGKECSADNLVISADYHFVEQNLLPQQYRKYTEAYWEKRKMAPSCLIYYLGIDKEIPNLRHHNLFFDEDLNKHGAEIYEQPNWPEAPLFYVCAPSKTDENVAPKGKENLFILIPIAPDLKEDEKIKEHYFNLVVNRIHKHTSCDISDAILFRRDYCIEDFKKDYNAFKGNAYGLANTLKQTANLKPKITSKLKNMVYCGQLTVPGPGVPPAMISGQLAANHLMTKL